MKWKEDFATDNKRRWKFVHMRLLAAKSRLKTHFFPVCSFFTLFSIPDPTVEFLGLSTGDFGDIDFCFLRWNLIYEISKWSVTCFTNLSTKMTVFMSVFYLSLRHFWNQLAKLQNQLFFCCCLSNLSFSSLLPWMSWESKRDNSLTTGCNATSRGPLQ